MAAHDSYRAQVELLIRCLPAVASAPDLVLKGGTAINLFLRDMPRLSVDIDLTYLPVSDRDTALTDIRSQLATIAEGLKQTVPGTNVQLVEGDAPKLLVEKAGARIKVEPSVVIRGSLVPPVTSALCSAAQEGYELFVEIQRLDSPDLYAGKLCAALDRQHPRDLSSMSCTFKQRDRSRIPYGKRLLPTSPVTGARSQSYCSRTANQSRACCIFRPIVNTHSGST